MRLLTILLLFFYISSNSQILSSKQLDFIDGVAYYNDSRYTGKVLFSRQGRTALLFNYVNGLREGKVKIDGAIITYKGGNIIDYVYYSPSGKELARIIHAKTKCIAWMRDSQREAMRGTPI